jgi:conjugative relaxase-like TrwC/TraI family protein
MATRQTHRRIHKIKIGEGQSAEAAVAYLADAQANGDYYTEGGSAIMLWLATDRARTYFGLGPGGGDVSRAKMAALLNGRHPTTGEKIRKEGQDGTMVGGIDLVLNPAPKSVSVLWAVANDELRRVLETTVYVSSTQAVRRMLAELPMVRDKIPGTNISRHVRADDWVAVQAIHTTARLTAYKGVPDPQLHVHNVLFGALSVDGRLRALDSLPMTQYHRELDAEAASDLAEELRLMGFPIRRVIERKSLHVIKSVKFELEGIPESLVEAMSARSREIGELRKQYEKVTGRPAEGPGWERFVGEHRGAKAKLTAAEMHAAWHDEAAEHDFDGDAIAEYVRRVELAKAAGVEQRGPTGWAAEQLRREILEELCREHALVPESDLNRLVMQLSIGLMGPVPAWRVLAKMYGAGDLLATTDGKVTTLEVLAAEQRATRAAQKLLDAEPGPAVDPADLEHEYQRAEEEGRPFDPYQRHAVALAVSGARLVSLSGPAGTGKSDPSDAMAAIWQGQGRRVIASAVYGLTAQKARADSGADEGKTVAKLLLDIETGKLRLQASDVVFVDEAGVIGHRQYAPLLEAIAEAGATLVEVGDDRQLSPLDAGGLWTVIHGMADANDQAAELREIHRARSAEERQAWTDLREGRVEEALTWYHDQGLLRMYDTRHQLLTGMLEEWWATQQERGVMVVDSSNAERDELNAMAQSRRLEAGELGAEVLRLESGSDVRVGDRVLFNAIYRLAPGATEKMSRAGTFPGPASARVENGTSATVLRVDPAAGTAILQLHEPKSKWRGSKSQAASVVEEDRELTVPASAPLELGYARHVVKAQGMTADVANIATGPYTAHNELYVMVTRSRNGTRIHTLRAEVEEMGADTTVVEHRTQPQRGITDAELLADLRARDLSLRAQAQDDRHALYPAELLALQQGRAGQEDGLLPPGATVIGDLFAEPVPVLREDPDVWEATLDGLARQARRSTTKQAIGRQTWTPMSEKEAIVDTAANLRDAARERDGPVDRRDLTGRLERNPPRPVQTDREPYPAPLPGREALDTAARDHARWCDAPKVLASYEVAGRLDIAADPAEQAARRWLADPEAVIVVVDQDQERLVRAAVSRLHEAVSQPSPLDERTAVTPPPTSIGVSTPQPWGAPRDSSPTGGERQDQAERSQPATVPMPHFARPLPPEPRIVHAGPAYDERLARRWARAIGTTHTAIVEPDGEPRAYVVAPVAPGSGWSYRDMTRALSVAASSHLISPPPDEATAVDTAREVAAIRASLDATRRAEHARQAATREGFVELDRRRARELDRGAERSAARL